MKPIVPYLWFEHEAEAAVDLYTHTFLHSHVVSNSLYSRSGAEISGQPEGSLLSIEFVIAGQPMVALNGGPVYSFTPANSFYVHCAFPEEVDRIYEKLSAGGEVLMELGAYPFSPRYAWIKDPFGVNWQIMQSDHKAQIVPGFLFTGPHIGQAESAIQHYITTIPNSGLQTLEKGPDGFVQYAQFTLNGQAFAATESSFDHGFDFSPAISYLLSCETQDEFESIWTALADETTKPQCGWVTDRFGITWQIVPEALLALIDCDDEIRRERVLKAMYPMKKINLAVLKQAFHGEVF
ncbi:MAG: VOC family protein [Clostridia bacterium]|nr:VOC family protein [Clostridia bacterium]NCC75499.1 VOC family protein [Clostridia bacterium]